MKTAVAILGLTLCLIVPRVQAADAPPKPSPEIQKMGIFAGKWHLEEEDEATPFGPAGKSTMESQIRFAHDGFALEENGKGKDSSGKPVSYTIVYFYDPGAKSLRSFVYDNSGGAFLTTGTLDGNSWKNHWTQQLNGKDYKCKGVSTVTPDGKKFNYEWSYSEDGVTWKPMFKGTATKG